MREYIGECKNCGKNIYCENGFFDGVLLPGPEYLCWECDEEEQKNQENQENQENQKGKKNP